MILWTIKLLTTLRRAIAGRRYPHQLAWAVAFGLLLGIIPHGNLLALVLLVVVLSLKLNHAAAGLTAIGVSFLASRLDTISHQVGDYVLTNPKWAATIADAWALPLVPWTNLNNTIVMGSFLIGVVALVPVFMITYPIFRAFRIVDPVDELAPTQDPTPPDVRHQPSTPVAIVDQSHAKVPSPHSGSRRHTHPSASTTDRIDRIEFHEIDGDASPAFEHDAEETPVQAIAVETRIDVIRLKEGAVIPAPHSDVAPKTATVASPTNIDEKQPMDEALNYLLRQLRDSQTRKSA
ncbi:hypothetical protein Poly51_42320 [Rubripirellula tenax]|uniref:DUF2062 domain-containing protein n=1 Tax=Rubripirellula tenax TaxID=2528015 RepID=A0A5C6ETZ7_9BACT|nr:TIGR03546 family protein [Rubripirellula tenax]TWU50939.1 hypothetical protein Poly51_42320 [Rubripirellula tenax]